MIYLDSAATSYYRPMSVVEAVTDAILHMGNANRGSYHTSLNAARTLYDTRELLSDFFNVGSANRIAFTYNVTHSLNMAILGLCTEEKRVLTTAMEHNSVLRPLYRAQEKGCNLSILPLTENLELDLKVLDNRLAQGVDIFICTHVSNVTGNVNDIYAIGEMCRKYGTVFILDAAQSAGIFDIDMKKANISVLCFTGHKSLLGPQGIGGICVDEDIHIPSFMAGGTGGRSFERTQPSLMPEALEAGTVNVHGVAGLHAGISYIMKKGLAFIRERESFLVGRFKNRIIGLPDVKFYGSRDDENRAGILAFNIGDVPSFEISDALSYKYGIMTRSGIHCAPLLHKAAGTEKQGMVRFSFSHLLSDEDVDEAAMALWDIVRSL